MHRVGPRAHVQRFRRHPDLIDPDQRSNSRSHTTHAAGWVIGHSIVTSVEPWRNWIRIGGSLEIDGRVFDIPTGINGGMTGSFAAGRAPRSASITHRRNRLAFKPLTNATAAIDMLGSLQAATASARNSALCRRRRRPDSKSKALVSTCPPIFKWTCVHLRWTPFSNARYQPGR